MIRLLKNILTVIFVWVTFLPLAQGQETAGTDTVSNLTGVTITTSVDRSESYIGDLIKYTIGITYDSSFTLIPPPLGANLGGFEVKDYEADIQSELDGGRLRSETNFILSAYIVGEYLIPPLPVGFIAPDSTRKVMLSESVPIKIRSLLENASDTTDIRPLKAPHEFERDYTNYYIYGGLALILILALGYWYYRRRQKGSDGEKIDPRQAWEIAFEKMAHLKEKGYLEDQLFKFFYIELSELSREFIGRIYRLDVLEMTTDEFLIAFKEVTLPGELYQRTLSFFRFSDLVKFAKLMPEKQQAEDDFLFVHELISDIRSDYERRRQLAAEAEALAKRAGRVERVAEENAG